MEKGEEGTIEHESKGEMKMGRWAGGRNWVVSGIRKTEERKS